jgi:hypothetical protein
MEAQSLLLTLGVLLLAIAFVARPFFASTHSSPAADRTRSRLMAERERLLTALRELDFDYALGKVPAEDYPLQRAELVRQGAEVMRRLDELPSPRPRAAQSQAAALATDEVIEERITSRRAERREKAGGFCPHCGKAVLAADRFCSHCGKALQ